MVDLRTSSRVIADPRTPGGDYRESSSRNDRILASPQRQPSPRKSNSRFIPTPQSMSPSKQSSSVNNFPPSFDTQPTQLPPALPSHYGSVYTPQSPYRPGEYQRSERCAPSERTRIERKLFEDDDDDTAPRQKDEMASSSPLAPAFEANMVLRNGASVDMISWLRTHFQHQLPPHTELTPFMSLEYVRRLLQERFPRVPGPTELADAVLAAFPHSKWDPPAANSAPEPPIMRGLTWHGRDVAEDNSQVTPTKARLGAASGTRTPKIDTDRTKRANNIASGESQSPTQSSLLSPVSSSNRRALPNTPARSVLDEFAEIATLTERTPVAKARSLTSESLGAPPPAPAYSLAAICNSTDRAWERKRRASQSPDLGHRRRASTPDKLHGLLAAAEAVEGSPLNSVLAKNGRGGHKRRRTIAGETNAHDIMFGNFGPPGARRARSARGTASPQIAGLSLLPHLHENIEPMLGPPVDEEGDDFGSLASPLLASEESMVSNVTRMQPWPVRRAPTSSSASQLSAISNSVSVAGPSTATAGPSVPTKAASGSVGIAGGGRKANELPTSSQGQYPGVDCKPPHPYHEMIRYAIEVAPDRKLQLAQIYTSIADRFPFFKTLDEKKTAGWQNSIRHNLSLKKMFVRVNKTDGVPDDSGGKGGWWTVEPGVPDEGRPGRKAKSKRSRDDDNESSPTSATATPAPTVRAAPTAPSTPALALAITTPANASGHFTHPSHARSLTTDPYFSPQGPK